MLNAIDQINATVSCERIAQIVREEVGESLIEDLATRGYQTYEQLAPQLAGYERDVVRAAKRRVAFLQRPRSSR